MFGAVGFSINDEIGVIIGYWDHQAKTLCTSSNSPMMNMKFGGGGGWVSFIPYLTQCMGWIIFNKIYNFWIYIRLNSSFCPHIYIL